MDRLLAESAILRTLYLFEEAEDNLDRRAMTSLFIPQRHATWDASEHLGDSPVSCVPDTFFHFAFETLSGFTATQHILSNPLFDFDDELAPTKCTVNIKVCAYHCIDEREQGGQLRSVTVRANQVMTMELWEKKWMVTGMIIKRGVPVDEPDLYGLARERFEQGLGRPER